MSDLRIGQRVRVRAGMHARAVGDVVELHPAAPHPYAVIESRGERIAAFMGVLDVLDDGSMRADLLDAAIAERDVMRERAVTAEQERDDLLAIIHRDGGHYVGEHGISKAVADAHATWAAVVFERDALRAGVDALRKCVRASWEDECPTGWLVDRLDAILAGGES